MKPYGYTGIGKSRKWDYGYEDVLAIQDGGRKSSIGQLPQKCGVYRSYTRNTETRNTVRRIYKKVQRRIYKQELKNGNG